MNKQVKMYDKLVDTDSLRLVAHADITKHRIGYAEYISGVPVDEEDLIELDELLKDHLVLTWKQLYGWMT